jgi:purine-binding chemotaxis protein CheW
MNETPVPALLVRVTTHTCALRLSNVIEVMRPLPVEALADAPEMVRGITVIRGRPVPVVALAALFDGGDSPAKRLVVVRAGDKQVALAVDAVLGVGEFAASTLSAMPPLLRDAAAGVVQTIGALDSDLFFVLNTASIIPNDLLESLTCQER